MEQKPSFFTVEQIARDLQVSEDTVRSWLKRKSNRLPSYRVGREFRIKIEDYKKFLQEQRYNEEGE